MGEMLIASIALVALDGSAYSESATALALDWASRLAPACSASVSWTSPRSTGLRRCRWSRA